MSLPTILQAPRSALFTTQRAMELGLEQVVLAEDFPSFVLRWPKPWLDQHGTRAVLENAQLAGARNCGTATSDA